jgi:hypothetical protein
MGADSSHQSLNAGAFRPDHNKSVLHQRQHSDPLSREDLEMYSRIGKSFINHHTHLNGIFDMLFLLFTKKCIYKKNECFSKQTNHIISNSDMFVYQ